MYSEQMFRDMQHANMEVHMSTTAGEREKCVDIALAVEMMHYATTPGAYDVAVLVTGDKDFMPAMARTRQRGKRVALATMRPHCNRDLLAPQSHVRDFSPVFIERSLRDLIHPLHHDDDDDDPFQELNAIKSSPESNQQSPQDSNSVSPTSAPFAAAANAASSSSPYSSSPVAAVSIPGPAVFGVDDTNAGASSSRYDDESGSFSYSSPSASLSREDAMADLPPGLGDRRPLLRVQSNEASLDRAVRAAIRDIVAEHDTRGVGAPMSARDVGRALTVRQVRVHGWMDGWMDELAHL